MRRARPKRLVWRGCCRRWRADAASGCHAEDLEESPFSVELTERVHAVTVQLVLSIEHPLLLLIDRLFKSARNPGSAPVVSLYFYARRILA